MATQAELQAAFTAKFNALEGKVETIWSAVFPDPVVKEQVKPSTPSVED